MSLFRARQFRGYVSKRRNVVFQTRHTRGGPFDCLSTHATYNRDTLGTCTVDEGLAASELQWFRTEELAALRRTKAQSHVSGMREAEARYFHFGSPESSTVIWCPRKDSLIPRQPLTGISRIVSETVVAQSHCIAMHNLMRSLVLPLFPSSNKTIVIDNSIRWRQSVMFDILYE